MTFSEETGFDPPDPFRVHRRFVILFGLPRVTDRKLGKCVNKSFALALRTFAAAIGSGRTMFFQLAEAA